MEHSRPTRTIKVRATWKIEVEVSETITIHIPNATTPEEISDQELADYIADEDLKYKYEPHLAASGRADIVDTMVDSIRCVIDDSIDRPSREITVEPFDD